MVFHLEKRLEKFHQKYLYHDSMVIGSKYIFAFPKECTLFLSCFQLSG